MDFNGSGAIEIADIAMLVTMIVGISGVVGGILGWLLGRGKRAREEQDSWQGIQSELRKMYFDLELRFNQLERNFNSLVAAVQLEDNATRIRIFKRAKLEADIGGELDG